MTAHTPTLRHVETDRGLVEDPRHERIFRFFDYSLIVGLSGFAIYCVIAVFSAWPS